MIIYFIHKMWHKRQFVSKNLVDISSDLRKFHTWKHILPLFPQNLPQKDCGRNFEKCFSIGYLWKEISRRWIPYGLYLFTKSLIQKWDLSLKMCFLLKLELLSNCFKVQSSNLICNTWSFDFSFWVHSTLYRWKRKSVNLIRQVKVAEIFRTTEHFDDRLFDRQLNWLKIERKLWWCIPIIPS